MKILKKDLRHGLMTIMPENIDDLWVLEKIIVKGDIIKGHTARTIKIPRGEEYAKERKMIFVCLEAESVEFNENQLRIKGKILESSEGEHGHHTFEIEPNEPVTIEKKWTKFDIERIEKSKMRHPKILICVLDDTEANFALMTERLQHLADIRGISGKSLGEEKKDRYFAEIIKYLSEKECEKIIIAGPGFAKEGLMNAINDNYKELAKKVIIDSVSSTGENGIQEVLRRGIIERIIKGSSISDQTVLVEDFFRRVSMNDKVVYGIEETKASALNGAVSVIIISDALVRNNEEVLRKAETFGAVVKIIDASHDAGKRFQAFGGIGGFLRYNINY